MASTIFWLVLIGVSALTAFLILIAPLHPPVRRPRRRPELAVQLTRIMLPIVALVTVSGIIVGILNAHDQFTIPALAPVAWNLVIIGGLLVFVPLVESESAELIVYAAATLVASVVQLLLPVPWLRGLDGRLRAVVDWRDPGQALLRADAARDSDARAHQHQHLRGRALRVPARRPRPRRRRSRRRSASTCSPRACSPSRS